MSIADEKQPRGFVAYILADGTRESIHTTAGHPFYVKDRGWVPAMYLGSGDTLSSLFGELSTTVEVVNTGRRETVYNLSVADAHTYFVGERGILVHSVCGKFFVFKPTKWWKGHGIDPHDAKKGFPHGDLVYNPKTGVWGFRAKGSPQVEPLGCIQR